MYSHIFLRKEFCPYGIESTKKKLENSVNIQVSTEGYKGI